MVEVPRKLSAALFCRPKASWVTHHQHSGGRCSREGSTRSEFGRTTNHHHHYHHRRRLLPPPLPLLSPAHREPKTQSLSFSSLRHHRTSTLAGGPSPRWLLPIFLPTVIIVLASPATQIPPNPPHPFSHVFPTTWPLVDRESRTTRRKVPVKTAAPDRLTV